jgi:hypothetical protein
MYVSIFGLIEYLHQLQEMAPSSSLIWAMNKNERFVAITMIWVYN